MDEFIPSQPFAWKSGEEEEKQLELIQLSQRHVKDNATFPELIFN